MNLIIHVTEPAVDDTALSGRLRALWAKAEATPNASPALFSFFPFELRFHRASHGEHHGALLCRIWQEIINDDSPFHFVSELDVVPQPNFFDALRRWVCPVAHPPVAALPPLSRVDPATGLRQVYTDLSAPWMMLFSAHALREAMPLDWLDAAGPFNDAANYGFRRLDCFVGSSSVQHLRERTDAAGPPILHGVDLPYTHLFFSRNFADPPDTVLLPNMNGSPYTVGQHLSRCESIVSHAEERFAVIEPPFSSFVSFGEQIGLPSTDVFASKYPQR